MSNYEGYTPGEIRICHDEHRIDYQWYAKVPMLPVEGEPIFRKFLAHHNTLEIKLTGPQIKKATTTIIAELERKGISTRQLRIRPYQEKTI